MQRVQYTYNYDPEMYKYILSTNILNKKKHEDKIFKALVDGYSCKEKVNQEHNLFLSFFNVLCYNVIAWVSQIL